MGVSKMNHREISIFTKDETSVNILTENELETRYKKYKAVVEELTIMDDIFMRNVLKEQECTEYILQVIMERKDLKVKEQVIQKDYKNLQGRSAILDCVARDSEETIYNIEIQQAREGTSPKRARYHSALLDMNTLEAGQDYNQLPENYVIFITRSDALGHSQPIYHVERRIREAKEDFKDGTHIIYVNAEKQEDTELGRLIHDLHCKHADDMYSEVLARRVRELKETQKGVEGMSITIEDIYQEGVEIGEKSGELKAKKETALSFARMGLSVEQIAEGLKENVKVIEEWISEGVTVSQ